MLKHESEHQKADTTVHNDEREGNSKLRFSIKLRVEGLDKVEPTEKELAVVAECCKSTMHKALQPCAIDFGSYHRVEFAIASAVVLECDCGETSYPSAQTDLLVGEVYRPIRDFINGADNAVGIEKLGETLASPDVDVDRIVLFRDAVKEHALAREARNNKANS